MVTANAGPPSEGRVEKMASARTLIYQTCSYFLVGKWMVKPFIPETGLLGGWGKGDCRLWARAAALASKQN